MSIFSIFQILETRPGLNIMRMDSLHNKQDFDQYKYKQKYHHSLKEHQIFSKIPKFLEFY